MNIKVYSTKTCPFCTMEKQYLDKRGVKYENILVDEDQDKAMEMVMKTGQMGVPVTIITDKSQKEHIIIGFDKQRIDTFLNI